MEETNNLLSDSIPTGQKKLPLDNDSIFTKFAFLFFNCCSLAPATFTMYSKFFDIPMRLQVCNKWNLKAFPFDTEIPEI